MKLLERIIYFLFTFFIFIVLWNVMTRLWEAFVPWNYKTDFIGVVVVIPLLIAAAFILSSLSFKVIKETK
ncbi:inhibitor of the pro-sigma K processing machinery [Falsibacillus pallidus]|uniref:Inhibitor of the pro-sigma K processing machinery n=1 Tax=Falsibacillus pallidus TaxID=493781 RepID=A0A370G9Q6_9BACI|nr:inhibitor of the pro-sigma K processing machinery [Falsibacillus pallidus]